MSKRKLEIDYDRDVRQRMTPCTRPESTQPESRKRCGEQLSQDFSKRMRMDFTLEEELRRLRASVEELRQNQHTFYKIIAGQAAQIRQLESQAVGKPENLPWVSPWIK